MDEQTASFEDTIAPYRGRILSIATIVLIYLAIVAVSEYRELSSFVAEVKAMGLEDKCMALYEVRCGGQSIDLHTLPSGFIFNSTLE